MFNLPVEKDGWGVGEAVLAVKIRQRGETQDDGALNAWCVQRCSSSLPPLRTGRVVVVRGGGEGGKWVVGGGWRGGAEKAFCQSPTALAAC